MLAASNGKTSSVPLSSLPPDQFPEATQDDALLADHVSVTESPLEIDVELAENVTAGTAGVTATVAVPFALTPAAVQLNANVVELVRLLNTSVPETALAPLQPSDAAQLVAPVLDHVTVVEPPDTTEVGLALMVTVVGTAAKTTTLAVWLGLTLPPLLVHDRV